MLSYCCMFYHKHKIMENMMLDICKLTPFADSKSSIVIHIPTQFSITHCVLQQNMTYQLQFPQLTTYQQVQLFHGANKTFKMFRFRTNNWLYLTADKADSWQWRHVPSSVNVISLILSWKSIVSDNNAI